MSKFETRVGNLYWRMNDKGETEYLVRVIAIDLYGRIYCETVGKEIEGVAFWDLEGFYQCFQPKEG